MKFENLLEFEKTYKLKHADIDCDGCKQAFAKTVTILDGRHIYCCEPCQKKLEMRFASYGH